MKVLYVIDSLAKGGAEQSLASLSPYLVDRGVALTVAHLHDRRGVEDEIRAGGAATVNLSGRGGRIRWPIRIAKLIYNLQPDLVHTTLFEADLAGRMAAAITRVPAVSSLVNTSYGPEHLGDPGLRRWRVRGGQAADMVTARVVVRFHAVTQDVAATMSTRLRVPRDRIDVVWRGRDPRRLGTRTDGRRAAARAALAIPVGVPVLLAVARQEYQKGLDVLLETASILARDLDPVRVVIAGREGNASAALRAKVTQLGLSGVVSFLGDRPDVSALMCAADVCLLPSRREGLPGVLLEAMALELPIVASDLPGVREAVGPDGIALLVPPEQPGPLAQAVRSVLADQAAAAARARHGRRRFEAWFTIERAAEGMVEFYRRALGNRSNAAARPRP